MCASWPGSTHEGLTGAVPSVGLGLPGPASECQTLRLQIMDAGRGVVGELVSLTAPDTQVGGKVASLFQGVDTST